MDLATKVITVLGAIGAIRGAFAAYSGWEEYSLGKKNQNPTQQDQGSAGILYGAMMIIGSGSFAAAIIAMLGQLSF